MHEQIFITALVAFILTLAARPWRELEGVWEPPPIWVPPAIRTGLWPTRKRKGPRARYPSGFA